MTHGMLTVHCGWGRLVHCMGFGVRCWWCMALPSAPSLTCLVRMLPQNVHIFDVNLDAFHQCRILFTCSRVVYLVLSPTVLKGHMSFAGFRGSLIICYILNIGGR